MSASSDAVSAITSENEPSVDSTAAAVAAQDAMASPHVIPIPGEASGGDEEAVPVTPMHALRRLALQGSIWTIVGYGLGEVIRLGGHLIIARLVAPEVFGIMALVTVFMTGLKMFSDIGIGPSIVQDRKGATEKFLNTAWTIQVMRGFGLAVLTVALAYPFGQYYSHFPGLWWLLMVCAVSPILDGFISTSLASLHRKLSIFKLTMFDLGTGVFRVLAAIGFVLLIKDQPALALILGNVLTEALRMVLSHTLYRFDRNRFTWDRESAKRLIRFGRWIFLATALTYFVGNADKLTMGKLFSDAELGVYFVAFMYAEAATGALRRLSAMVLFPLYSRLADHGGDTLKKEMVRMRVVLMALTLPVLWTLAIFGTPFIKLLGYDPEYHNAGWMLQILAMGAVVSTMAVTLSPVILAMGDSFRNMVLLITRTIFLFAAMWAGYHFFGKIGLIVGVSMASALNYPVLVMFAKKYGAWTPWLDLGAMAISAIVITLGLLIVGLPVEWGQFSP